MFIEGSTFIIEGIPNDKDLPLPLMAWNKKFLSVYSINLGIENAYINEGLFICKSSSPFCISFGTLRSSHVFFLDYKSVTTSLNYSCLIPLIKSWAYGYDISLRKF